MWETASLAESEELRVKNPLINKQNSFVFMSQTKGAIVTCKHFRVTSI